MKKLAFLFVLMCTTAFAFAQPIATLQHGENFSVYYGIDAFAEASAAADDGDIITLSSGQFNGAEITKAITLHGAGVVQDEISQTPPTTITSFTHIDIESHSLPLNIEGVNFNSNVYLLDTLFHANFMKCDFSCIASSTCTFGDVQFINCRLNITSVRTFSDFNTNLRFFNSVVTGLSAGPVDNIGQYLYAYNTIFYNTLACAKFYLYNCILLEEVFSDSFFYNCLGYNTDPSYTGTNAYYDCIMNISDITEIFANIDHFAPSLFEDDFSLTDEMINSFHGTDGGQVGIYGGAMPHNTRPGYLILNRTTVGSQSDPNGFLNMDIEILDEE